MADSINTINVGGIDKEVEDTVARSSGTLANNRCTTLESSVSNLAARVEEMIAPTGEAPSPEEILDARVGADNVVYDTLGNAIRTQVSNLKTDCSTLFDVLNGKSSFINVVNASVDINNNGILEYGHPDRLTTKDIIELDYPFVIKINEPYLGWIAYYDDNDDFVSWENIPPQGGSKKNRLVDAGKRFRIILRARGTSVPISIEEYRNLTITNREFFYDYIAAFSNYCEGSYSYRSIYSFDDIDKIVFAVVNNSGVTKVAGRLTTSDIRTAETSLIIKARKEYKNSWIAYYDDPSDVAYSSWSYIRDTIIIPEGAHYRIVIAADPEREMEAYEAFSSIYIQSPIVSIISGEYLKVCSFNVGAWFNGVTPGVPDSNVDEYIIRWRKLIGANNPDIVILQEATQYFDRSETMDSYETVFKHKYPYKYNVGFSTSYSATIKQMMIVSKLPLMNPTVHEFGDGDTRGYITFSVNVRKNVINFIATHLSIEANSTGVRQTEISTLANLMNSYENVVLAGDMNLYSLSELSPFRNAGYELSNDGLFGQYNTWPHDRETWPNECIDNIISKNLAIQNVYMGSTEDATGDESLSDHVPLYTEIKMN